MYLTCMGGGAQACVHVWRPMEYFGCPSYYFPVTLLKWSLLESGVCILCDKPQTSKNPDILLFSSL